MKIKFVKLLAVLAILGSLLAVAIPASAATATLSPTSGTVGSAVTVTAEGFAPSAVLTVRFDGAAVTTAPATITSSTSGAATFAVLIPATGAGIHQITVTDGVNTVVSSFTVNPKITVSPASAQPGASITVTGTGFSNLGVTVTVVLQYGSPAVNAPILVAVPVDSTGSFSGTGTVPATASSGNLIAQDGAGKVGMASLTVLPRLALNPTSGLPGTSVAVTGSGWNPAGGNITIAFAGTPVATIAQTASFNTTITVPAAASSGVKAVTATQGATNVSTNYTVSTRLLTVTPAQGPAGTQVVITGTDLTAGGTIAAIMLGNTTLNASAITIDSTGTMAPFTVRLATATLGTNFISAVDSGGRIAMGMFVETASTLTASPAAGPKGTMVTFSGTNWVPGVQVTITLAGATVSSTPDSTGAFAAALAVPAAAAVGANTASASDAYLNSATATFTVPPPAITVTPDAGPAGTTVTVSGTGFAGYSAVNISIGGFNFAVQPLTDAMGSFSTTVTVPALAPGASVFSVAAGGATVTKLFTISSAAPTVASVVNTVSDTLVRIWGYTDGTWKMYDPADAAGSDLAALVAGKGYWINVSAADTLVYGGFSYPLSAGWNLIGWR